jgi:hypothetical protein
MGAGGHAAPELSYATSEKARIPWGCACSSSSSRRPVEGSSTELVVRHGCWWSAVVASTDTARDGGRRQDESATGRVPHIAETPHRRAARAHDMAIGARPGRRTRAPFSDEIRDQSAVSRSDSAGGYSRSSRMQKKSFLRNAARQPQLGPCCPLLHAAVNVSHPRRPVRPYGRLFSLGL